MRGYARASLLLYTARGGRLSVGGSSRLGRIDDGESCSSVVFVSVCPCRVQLDMLLGFVSLITAGVTRCSYGWSGRHLRRFAASFAATRGGSSSGCQWSLGFFQACRRSGRTISGGKESSSALLVRLLLVPETAVARLLEKASFFLLYFSVR